MRNTGQVHAGSRRRVGADEARRSTRRKLLVALGAGALAPVACFAQQQAKKIARVGYLVVPTQAASAQNVEGFRRGLRELGYVEGKTIVLEVRYGEGRPERVPELARELVGLKVDVIVTTSELPVAAVKRETRTIPIVMVNSSDPVGTGLVASLARPGGNVTGLSNMSPELSGKRLELLREIIPGLSRVAILWNPDFRGAMFDYKETEGAARSLHLQLLSVEVLRAEDLDRAFSAVTEQRAQALIVTSPNPVLFSNRGQLASFVQRNRLPSIYRNATFVDAGGLISYGPSTPDLHRRGATYVDKILKGAKPANLPIEQPTKFELVVNLKTAKALGLKIPNSILVRAERVIE